MLAWCPGALINGFRGEPKEAVASGGALQLSTGAPLHLGCHLHHLTFVSSIYCNTICSLVPSLFRGLTIIMLPCRSIAWFVSCIYQSASAPFAAQLNPCNENQFSLIMLWQLSTQAEQNSHPHILPHIFGGGSQSLHNDSRQLEYEKRGCNCHSFSLLCTAWPPILSSLFTTLNSLSAFDLEVFALQCIVLFIGPESDHWQCLSVIHWLPHSFPFSKLDWCNSGVWRLELWNRKVGKSGKV